jgi:hypothetical protein
MGSILKLSEMMQVKQLGREWATVYTVPRLVTIPFSRRANWGWEGLTKLFGI